LLRIPISEQTKQEIVAKWLSGWPRDKIAGELSIGAGTVSKIVTLWNQEVGAPTAEAFRELSVEIRRSGISIRECARGLRFVRFLQGMSGDEETKQIEIFLEKIYNKSKYFNVSPENLIEIASEIWELSKTMPTKEISSYLKSMMKEKERIEGEINELNNKREHADSEHNRSLQAARTKAQELQDFIAARQYLATQGMDINDLNRLTMAIHNATTYSFDINQIVQKISGNESLIANELDLRRRIKLAYDDLEVLKNAKRINESDIDEGAAKIKYSKELESIGFGVNELIEVKRMLVAIAEKKKSEGSAPDPAEVIETFFRRVEELRDLEAKLESLKEEVSRIEEQRKSQIHEMDKFMEKLKADIGELSCMAIQAIKLAYQKGIGNFPDSKNTSTK
jgi:antitoxin component HigA of HigAB toxin-antitoxin module